MTIKRNLRPSAKTRHFALDPLFCALAISSTYPALAQSSPEQIEEVERIEVSASLSNRDLYSLSGSNIVLSDAVLLDRQARHVQDVLAVVPNVNFTAGSSRGKFIQIRGIGERSQFSEPVNPSIGLLLDDIDISGLGSLATLYDLRQLEVLSGPQSVAVGVNSLGGVVKLLSTPAEEQNSGRFSASIAQNNAYQLGGAYGASLSDGLSIRASAQLNKDDGDVYNAFLDRDDTNNIDETTATFFINKTFKDSQQLGLNLYYFNIDNGYDAFSLDNDQVTQSDEPGFDRSDAVAGSIKYQHGFDNSLAKVVLTYLDGEFDYGYDEDWTYPAFHPFTYSSFDRYLRDVKRSSIEFTLSSRDTGLLNDASWVFGLNWRDATEDLLREYTFNSGDFVSQYKPQSASAFGQYSFALSQKLQLTLASRLERFRADYDDSDGFDESLDDTLVAGSISLDYRLDDSPDSGLSRGSIVYASLSRGYKAGGFNFDQRLSANNRTFAPEYNWNIETGIKGTLVEGLANYQLSAFYMRRQDAQVSDFATFENVLEDGSVVTAFADAIRNTDTGVNKGIELTSAWQLSDNWQINANVGYLDATFGDYTRIDGSFVPKQDQAQAPSYTFYLSSEWVLSDSWRYFVDVDAKDEFRFSDGHDERSPSTVVINTHLSWQHEHHEVRLWVKNLSDELIYTRGFGGFSNDPRDEYAFVEPYFQFGQPRQVGVSYEYQF
ncbi:TonB-dependent receptor [Glaciecola siphonariae]|uniref:TonB-dependent receptor n=1 Tax=Glaciecola siphonariae TaxID=521012 RepID=A0ABV9LTK6_9ALTE